MRRVDQPTTLEKHIDLEEWFDKLRAAKVDKQEMNMLVMDYFIKEGYADAAAAFHEESLTEPVSIGHEVKPVDLATLKARTAVRNAVDEGDVLKAIERVNELDPNILTERPKLSFKLQQERLIELIQCAHLSQTLVSSLLPPTKTLSLLTIFQSKPLTLANSAKPVSLLLRKPPNIPSSFCVHS